jgi:branched-chain amino acid aminotransferase
MAKRCVWLDGHLVPAETAACSVLSHAMQRGSLVFDVGVMREGRGGVVVLFRAREHIERFLRSASLVGLEVAADADSLLAATVETARESEATSALVRWSAFIASLEADVVPRRTSRASVAIAVIAPEDYAADGGAAPRKPAASRVSIARDARKAGPEVLPPQAKVAASYLGPMLAKRRAIAEGFDEVVLLDRDGCVAEAPTANVFAVRGGTLLTPPTDRVLAGITRDSVLALAQVEGIAAREAPMRPDELADADEAFLTATSLPVQPIASIDGRPLRGGAPGPMTGRIVEAFAACERGDDARFSRFVLAVR